MDRERYIHMYIYVYIRVCTYVNLYMYICICERRKPLPSEPLAERMGSSGRNALAAVPRAQGFRAPVNQQSLGPPEVGGLVKGEI